MAKQNWKYNFDFDQFDPEPLPDHTCAICMNVFRDPRQNICGHVFCVRCLERWLITEKRDSCPLCRASMTPSQLTPVKDDLQDAIGRLTLHCAVEGCPDMLSINTYGDHMDGCELYPVPCHWYFCRSSVPRKGSPSTHARMPVQDSGLWQVRHSADRRTATFLQSGTANLHTEIRTRLVSICFYTVYK